MLEVCIKSLAVTYFHMGKPHTIIGAKQFHFRVRDGIGWFPLANAARQTVRIKGVSTHFLRSISTKNMGTDPFYAYLESCKGGYVA